MRRLGTVSRPQGLPHEILFCSNAAKRHDTLAEVIQRRSNGRLLIMDLRLSFVGLTWSSANFVRRVVADEITPRNFELKLLIAVDCVL